MNIDNFEISEECRNKLKRSGYTAVEEIVEFLEDHAKGGTLVHVTWARYFDEIVEQLKVLGMWTDALEQYYGQTD